MNALSPRSLYTQIVLLFLLLLLAFTAVAVMIASRQFDGFLEELEQRLNLGLAGNLAVELGPALKNGADDALARQALVRVSGTNPGRDIYVLDGAGRVLASNTGAAARIERIDIAPLRRIHEPGAMLPLRGQDPGDANAYKVFSATRLEVGGKPGYLYVILRGMPFEAAASMLRTSYIARAIGSALLGALLCTLVIGAVLFAILTRRFRRLTQEMASTIDSQVAALKQADAARRALAANISHDFRTPLTSLRAHVDRLIASDDRAVQRESLDAMLRNSAQIEHLADQLAATVELDSVEEPAARFEPFDMVDLAHDVLAKFAPLAANAGIALALPQPTVPVPVPVRVRGDIALIERALSNVLDNALQNTPAGGNVRLAIGLEAERVLVSVADSGAGIAQDEIGQVTQRFYRTHASRAAGRRGSGLGLSIVREIMELHRGALAIQSPPGAGTTVTLALPRA
jgi:signal transduction histidine kinase